MLWAAHLSGAYPASADTQVGSERLRDQAMFYSFGAPNPNNHHRPGQYFDPPKDLCPIGDQQDHLRPKYSLREDEFFPPAVNSITIYHVPLERHPFNVQHTPRP